MLSALYSHAIAATAGLFGGLCNGVCIATKTEMSARGMEVQFDPLAKVAKPMGVIAQGSAAIILLAIFVTFGTLTVLRLGGVYCLGGNLRVEYGISLLVGMAIGKFGRYRYWSRASF